MEASRCCAWSHGKLVGTARKRQAHLAARLFVPANARVEGGGGTGTPRGPGSSSRRPPGGGPFVAARRFAPATARVEGGGGHHLPGTAVLRAGGPWDVLLLAARRFAPATARVEGGGEQARPSQQGLPRGLARQSRACGAHGAARSLERSRGRRPARLGSVGPAPDSPAQRAVLGGHAGRPRAMGSHGLARRGQGRPRGLRRARMGSAGARGHTPDARRAHLRHGRPVGAGHGFAVQAAGPGRPMPGGHGRARPR